MESNSSIQRYKYLYSKLLLLYPKPYFERFGEEMKLTFGDICRDRVSEHKGLFNYFLWAIFETSIQIFKKNITYNSMEHTRIKRIALITVLILLIPLIAMQFTAEVNWTLGDFIIMGALIFGTGLAYELISRKMNNKTFKLAVAIGVGTTLFMTWVNLAVGIIGSEDNAVNLMYFGVPLVALVGAFIAKFKPFALSRAMFATALYTFIIPFIALAINRPDISPGVFAVIGLNSVFALMFVASGLLFKKASILSSKQA